MQRFVSLTVLLGVFFTLSLIACGQKGDLFLPQVDQPEPGAESTHEKETEYSIQS